MLLLESTVKIREIENKQQLDKMRLKTYEALQQPVLTLTEPNKNIEYANK